MLPRFAVCARRIVGVKEQAWLNHRAQFCNTNPKRSEAPRWRFGLVCSTITHGDLVFQPNDETAVRRALRRLGYVLPAQGN